MSGVLLLAAALGLMGYWKYRCRLSVKYLFLGVAALIVADGAHIVIGALLRNVDLARHVYLVDTVLPAVLELAAIFTFLYFCRGIRRSGRQAVMGFGLGCATGGILGGVLIALNLLLKVDPPFLMLDQLALLREGSHFVILLFTVLLAAYGLSQERRWVVCAVVYRLLPAALIGVVYYLHGPALPAPEPDNLGRFMAWCDALTAVEQTAVLTVGLPFALVGLVGIFVLQRRRQCEDATVLL